MANCGQACPYNTLDGCKVKEYNAICPLTNMATPFTEYRMTNADRIRAMSDEELAKRLIFWNDDWDRWETDAGNIEGDPRDTQEEAIKAELAWLQQPAEGE